MINVINLTTGDKVTGVYYGVAFSGTVTSSRFSTVRHDTRKIHIALDSAMEIPQMQVSGRLELLMEVLGDGTHYSRPNSWINR